MMMYKQYINGRLVDGLGKEMKVYNPATDEVVGVVGCATAEQAKEALSAAEEAFKSWSRTTVTERAEWLYRFRDACIEEKEHLIDLVSAESGRPYAAALGDVNWLLTSFTYYAEEAKRTEGNVQ